MFKQLRRVGLRSGLTYQSLPFNFANSYRNNELRHTFKPNIERLNKLTGKRVIIMGHSLGNTSIKYQLSLLDQEFKDTHVKQWISVAPTLYGAMQATKVMIGGDDEYFFLNSLGFRMEASVRSFGSFPSLFELIARNMYAAHSDEPWFKWVLDQLKYENGEITKAEAGMYFWPEKDKLCTPDSFVDIPQKCISGLKDMRKSPSMEIEGKSFYFDNNEELIGQFELKDYSLDYFKFFKDKEFAKMENPGVPVFLVYSKSSLTESEIKYQGKISDYTDKNEFPKYEVVHGFGDATVAVNSSVIPGIKWSYEYQNRDPNDPKAKNLKVPILRFWYIQKRNCRSISLIGF